MVRSIETATIKRFKGLNSWNSVSLVKPNCAIDCLNVIPSSSGGLEKLRYPVNLSASPTSGMIGIGNIVNFQNALGTRQVLAMFNGSLYSISLDDYTATLIETNALNAGVLSFTTSNNLTFTANGQRMMKWNGTAYQNWGIAKPVEPSREITSISLVDPTVAPTLTGWPLPSAPGGTYSVSYTWTLGNGETLESPAGGSTCPPGIALIISIPIISGATGFNVYVDPLGGANRHRVNTSSHMGIPNPISGNPSYWRQLNINDLLFHDLDPTPPLSNTTGASGLSLSIGRRYKIAYGNSITGHIGVASEPSETTGAIITSNTLTVICSNPTDTQCDQIWLFSTMDGGGDYFLNENSNSSDGSWPITAGDTTTIIDYCPDANLNKAIIAPMLNYPPPIGKYTCEWGGRIFVSGIVGAKQDIVYSGYERIYQGRPEESFPPNNRLRLAIGSDAISGHGVIQAGIVAFSISNEMFMLRGTVTDRSTDAPIEYLAELEKLPWNTGCASHYSITRSPYGLIWFASDKTIKIYNGTNQPRELSGDIMPLLRRITPGTEGDCRGIFYCFLEREWYMLLCSLDGSLTKNYILICDLNPDIENNSGCFPLNIQADAMEIVEDANGISHVVIMQDGYAKELIVNSDTTGGMSLTYMATGNNLPAYWRSGYFGNESPEWTKLFRYGRLITDQLGFSLQHYLVDDNFLIPEIIPFSVLVGSGFSLNRKSRRMSTEIQFPAVDTAANVLEFSISSIKTSQR